METVEAMNKQKKASQGLKTHQKMFLMNEREIISSMDKSEAERRASKYLYCAMSIGEKLLACGAEVSRVEDTITRLCHAYGVERVDVFTITSSIVVTISGDDFGVITQTRRIRGSQYNLRRLEQLNQLSRKICASQMSVESIERELVKIEEEQGYSTKGMLLGYVVISASFALFFGGTVWDAIASAIIAVFLKGFGDFLNKLEMNTFLTGFLSSVLGGFAAVMLVDCGFGQSVEYINLGNVMLLIPGIAFTNGIRDMFNGDLISGLFRFLEALLLGITIAVGFVFVQEFFG